MGKDDFVGALVGSGLHMVARIASLSVTKERLVTTYGKYSLPSPFIAAQVSDPRKVLK